MKFIKHAETIDVLRIEPYTTIKDVEKFMSSFGDSLVFNKEQCELQFKDRIAKLNDYIVYFPQPATYYDTYLTFVVLYVGRFFVRIPTRHHSYGAEYKVFTIAELTETYHAE